MSREQGLADVIQAIYDNPSVPQWLRVAAADALQQSPEDAARFIRGAWGQKRPPIAFPAEAHVIMLEQFGQGSTGPIFLETEIAYEPPETLTLHGAMAKAARIARGARWLVCKVTPVAASGPEGWAITPAEAATPVVTPPSGHGPESRL